LALMDDGSLAVCGSDPTSGNGAVFSVQTDGTTALLAAGGALTEPTGIAVVNETIYMTDAGLRLPRAQLVAVGTRGGTPTVVTAIQDTCLVESGVAAVGGTVFLAARHAGAGKITSVMAGSSTETPVTEGGSLVSPQGVASNNGMVYVADQDAGGAGEIFVLQ